METSFCGKMVDVAVETEKEVDLRKRAEGSFGIIELHAEYNEAE